MKWRSVQPQHSEPDEHFIARYQEHADPDSPAILFERYVELIFGVCLKYLKDPQDSEDAAMEIFEILTQKLKTHTVDSFRGWLYTVTKNHCLQILRKRQRSVLTEVYEEQIMQSALTEHPVDDFDQLPVENGLRDCMEKLPSAQKMSIELFYFQSKTYQEVAELMTLDKEQVRSHLQNGRRNLRLCMDGKDKTVQREKSGDAL